MDIAHGCSGVTSPYIIISLPENLTRKINAVSNYKCPAPGQGLLWTKCPAVDEFTELVCTVKLRYRHNHL